MYLTILLTNDDGIYYNGLLALKRELEKLDDVVIVAPLEESSNIGKVLSYNVQVKRVMFDGEVAYAVKGTPADSVLIALTKILSEKPSLVVSGINGGANLGLEEFFTSGTIGAAIEAALHGIPSIAVSLAIADLSIKYELDLDSFSKAAIVAREATKFFLEEDYGSIDILNINVPEKADLKKALITTLAPFSYGDIYRETIAGKYEMIDWRIEEYESSVKDSDIYAIRSGYISITPITLRTLTADLKPYSIIRRLRNIT